MPSDPTVFLNRRDAGRRLAEYLTEVDVQDAVALGLPRGGVPIAYEVAAALRIRLDVLVVRKLGAPGRPELALGAIGEGDVRVLNRDLVRRLRVDRSTLAAIEAKERVELERRATAYRAGRERVDLQGSTAIVVDDGVATGATARAGCAIARAQGASRVILAVPVAPLGWTPGRDADRLVTVVQPYDMRAVGNWYQDFSQTTDEQVTDLLALDTTGDAA